MTTKATRLAALLAVTMTVGLWQEFNRTRVGFPAYGAENEVTLSFGQLPELNEPVDLTLSVVPDATLPDADVTVFLVPQLDILDAAPPGYQIVDSDVIWAGQSLAAPGTHVFTVTLEASEEFYDQITGLVYENTVVGTSEKDSDVLHVKVTSTEAVVGDVPPELSEDISLAQTWKQDKLDITVGFSHLPTSNEVVTSTVTVTNTTTSDDLSYDGVITPPLGWKVQGGTTTWSTTLPSAQSETRTVTLQSEESSGDWAMQVDLTNTASAQSEPNYHVNYYAAMLLESSGPGSTGGTHEAPAAAYFVGVQPFRYMACVGGAGAPVLVGGVLQPADDVDCEECEHCRFTMRGLLTSWYGLQQRETVLPA